MRQIVLLVAIKTVKLSHARKHFLFQGKCTFVH